MLSTLAPPEDTPQVSFGLSEWLMRVETKLDEANRKLDGKADRTTVDDLGRRLLMVETAEKARRDIRVEEQQRMARLETGLAQVRDDLNRAAATRSAEAVAGQSRSEFRRWILPTTASLAMVGVMLTQVFQ